MQKKKKPISQLAQGNARSEWILLRSLVMLRWMAIAGQLIAISVATLFLEIDLNIGVCLAVVGASILVNVSASIILPVNRRLSQTEALFSQSFDLVQLGVLLYLTGGLNNPFAILILAPVTISATALTLSATIFLATFAMIITTLLTFNYVPIMLMSGQYLEQPALLLAGNWVSILIGILFLSSYARRVTSESFSMSQALAATQMALEREHRLTALGGVVAAAAHEMGTPLATIKLVSSELQEELSDRPELAEDATLISEQATRLAQILKDMGRSGKDDKLMKQAPVTTIVQEAAEPHENRGKQIKFRANGETFDDVPRGVPILERHPEIIHGLRNLIQNAVDFADTGVWVYVIWNQDEISIMVRDDGPGFPSEFIGRLGDPFLARRSIKKAVQENRPEYEGMGLGLFIAKTLLERTGASITFVNANAGPVGAEGTTEAPFKRGALVKLTWVRSAIEIDAKMGREALGENTRNHP